jgi:hypothetical protein
MPRPARLIATAILVLAVSVLGSTAAYAHDPKPDGGVTRSHTAPHAKKHAHTITRKTARPHTAVRHVRAGTTHRQAKGVAKHAASGRTAPPESGNVVPGLVGNLLDPIASPAPAATASGALPIAAARTVRSSGTSGEGNGQGTGSGAGGASSEPSTAGKPKPHQAPSQSSSATVPYQATERRQERASVLLFALIAVFGAAMTAMIVGAGYRGRKTR